MRLLVLSDIHGNLTALDAVLRDAKSRGPLDAWLMLGDAVDYGMRSNEVAERLSEIELPLIAGLWGNHERAVLTGDLGGFSSKRGEECAKYTAATLSERARECLRALCDERGLSEFTAGGKRCLAVHGSLDDVFWGAIAPDSELSESLYAKYDCVFSGHSHLPHAFVRLYPSHDAELRYKKRTEFVNAGSVGQPRDRDPRAKYAIWDSGGSVELCAAEYDVKLEMSLYRGQVDDFYARRLEKGV